ncbi:MAG: hypothetical protein WC306_01065 [Candidatus Paceibacterota bacterium]|jgi:hypothetical protein
MDQEKQFSQIIAKIQELKKGKNPLDLSSKEDLAIGVMNLISLEEHFFFTYNKTNNNQYLELLNQIRSMRKDLLKEIVKNPKGEIWCVSKHLLAACTRLMEVGTKKLSDGEKDKAKELFKKSYTLWNIFWGLNLELIEVKDIAEKDDDPENKESIELNDGKEIKKKISIWSKLGDTIQEVLDCCKE